MTIFTNDPTYDRIWWWRKRLPERKGEDCRLVACGAKNSELVEFRDGTRVVTSRYAFRKRPELERP